MDNITFLKINDANISDPLEIASYLNNYFSTAPSLIIDEFLPTPVNNENPNHDNVQNLFSLSDIPITEHEVSEAFAQLDPKKSNDSNNISMFFLKNFTEQLLLPLTHIISGSATHGIVPSQMKIAKIVPVFKSGNASSMDNYRPIALLSNFSKILKK